MRQRFHRGYAFLCVLPALALPLVGCSSSDSHSPSRQGTSSNGGGNQNDQTPSGDCSAVSNGDVTISAPSGTFQGALPVELSTAITSAEIRYTTNGDPPTATSSLYSGTALSITATTRLRAQAFVQGVATGTASAALYVARSIDATHDLPLILLDSYGSGPLPTAEAQRQDVSVAFLSFALSDGAATLSSRPTAASFATFHVRGQSSTMFAKVPYRLELRNEAGAKRDCSMFGMPSESAWALVGPYPDKTLIHNNFVYELGREIGLQAPRARLVEAYINLQNRPLAAQDYQGVYQVVEIIKNQKNRLNLKQLDETVTTLPDITGGYIFKFEWKASEPPLLPCPSGAANCWSDLEIVDPDPINQQQLDYLAQYVRTYSDALHSTTLGDMTVGYPAYLDTASFVDVVIINEFTRNLDAFARSQYFYKDRDAKVSAGPLWDFDTIAGVGVSPTGGGVFGVTNFANTETDGWQYESNSSRLTANTTSDWFPILIEEPNFKAKLASRWRMLRSGPLSDSGIASRIDTAAAGLANAADRNFKKWDILSQQTVTPFSTPTEPTWSGQITYMKTWLQKRAAWLDTQW
jgi:hypothetical protein